MGFQKVFGHREKVIIGELTASAPLYPYTHAFVLQVIANGGFVTVSEIGYLYTFESNMGSDLAEFDRLWIHSLKNQIAAQTSFVNPSSTMITAVNSPTFTPNQGFKGNGTSSFLRSNFTPIIDAVKFTLNSANAGYYIRLNLGITATLEMGGYNPANYFYMGANYAGYTYYDINNGAYDSSILATGTTQGLFSNQRTSFNNTNQYKNGILKGSSNAISYVLPNISYFLMCINGQNSPILFSSNEFSLSFFSSGNVNQSNFYNSVQTLGSSMGWAV